MNDSLASLAHEASPAPEIAAAGEEAEATARGRGLGLTERHPWVWIAIALVAVIAAFTADIGPRFVDLSDLGNLTLSSAETIILAVPMTLILIAAGLDLSVGAMLILSSVASATTMLHVTSLVGGGGNWLLAVIVGVAVGLAAGVLCGVVNGVIIAYFGLPPFIVTLGTLGIYTGAAELLTGGTDLIGVPSKFQNDFGLGKVLDIPIPFLIAVLLAAIGWVVLEKTRYGAHTFAIGTNKEAARLAGIKIKQHLFLLYLFAGLAAGIAGVIDISRFGGTSIEAHTTDNLLAIEAVVLGGTSLFGGIGNMGGTVIGALFPAILTSGLVEIGLPSFWQPIAIGVVLIVAVSQDMLRQARLKAR